MRLPASTFRALLYLLTLFLCPSLSIRAADEATAVACLSPQQAREYKLDATFFRKCLLAEEILIATSEHVSDFTILEAAYQFRMVMKTVTPEVARRIRDQKVLCVLLAHNELTSRVPLFATDKTGKELDFYNWRQRGFLTTVDDRQVVLFAEEDVMEYAGGMQNESILIHEFGHVIQGAGFDKELNDRVKEAFRNAKDKGRYQDGYAAQRFRRVKSPTPVSLIDALVKSFPVETRDFFADCLTGGDILINGKPAPSHAEVTRDDSVLIVFGGPKQCYAAVNAGEYWAEGVQDWYDTNRTMDHDHNHIHTRHQLKTYDPELADLCSEVLGDTEWRFVSPRTRAGTGHLIGYDLTTSPTVQKLEHIDLAAQDYYDTYWHDYWQRLHEKHIAHASPKPSP